MRYKNPSRKASAYHAKVDKRPLLIQLIRCSFSKHFFGNDSLNDNFEFYNDRSPLCALLNQLASCQGKTFGCFTDFLICSFMTIVDKYASSWRQEIKSQKGSGLKRFRQSSDWQIEEFKGTESFCQLVFPKNFVYRSQSFCDKHSGNV